MKKILALVLAVVMVMSLMAACTPAETNPSSSSSSVANSSSSNAGSSSQKEEFSYPMDTDAKISIWMRTNSNIKNHYGDKGNFDALKVSEWLEEATGIDVEWFDDYADGNADLQRMWAEKDYQDIISINWANQYSGGAAMALEDGVIISLNEVIDKYMPNFKAWMEENPDLAKEIKTDDGDIFMIPNVETTGAYTYPTYYREDILKEMGEKEPTTIEGWYNLLKKVKAQYPDMTPLMVDVNFVNKYGAFTMAYGVGGSSTQNFFEINDGKVVYQKTENKYREYLKEMNKWASEGLINADWASKKTADVNKDMINGKAFMSGGWITGAMQSIQQSAVKIEGQEDFMLKAIATPQLTEGVKPEYVYASSEIGGIGCAISTKCENVEVAARLLDYWWSEEGLILINFGKEGESYTMVDGVPTFKPEVVDATNPGYPSADLDGKAWTTSESVARYSYGVWPVGHIKHEDYAKQLYTEKCVYDAVDIMRNGVEGGGYIHNIPALSYTSDEGTVVTLAMSNLVTLTNEYSAKFINSALELNDDSWNAFVKECQKVGSASTCLIMQGAYARWEAR